MSSTIYTAIPLLICRDLTQDYDASHDLNHHIKVWDNCEDIVKGESANERVRRMACIAALLHDIIDSKYPDDMEYKQTKVEHYLDSIEDGENIKWIIYNISYSKEKKSGYPIHTDPEVQLARDIVSDADKLEALGVVGLRRCREYTKYKNPIKSDEEILKLVVEHCQDKLLKLKDEYIRTKTGKEMAKNKHKYILDYVNPFESVCC